MFSTMPALSVHCDEGGNSLPAFNFTASSPYRPTISSPLSSSPIRASTPPPLSPRDPNARREVQSSPIPAPTASSCLFGSCRSGGDSGSGGFSSKFAARPTRPVPVVAGQKREAAQESRRKLFLKNVRQRAEDGRWERRGGEQELLKLEWSSLNRDIQQARNADLDGVVFESDIEDAARLREEVMQKHPSHPSWLEAIPEEAAAGGGMQVEADADEIMVDMLEQEQQAELDALVSSMPEGQQQLSSRSPDSPHLSDDYDYDALFLDYLSQEEQGQVLTSSGDMDLS